MGTVEPKHWENLKSLLEHTSDSVYFTNKDGIIEYVNPAFEVTTGYSSSEAIGRNPRFLKSGSQPSSYYKKLWRTILSGKVFSGNIINKRKDGTLLHERKTISPLHSKSGELTHFMAVDSDLTSQVTLEKEILSAGEQERRRLGIEFHDELGQSLAGIALFSKALAQNLESENSPASKQAQDIADLANQAVKQSRQLSRELYPAALENAGIEEALQQMVGDLEIAYKVELKLKIDLEAPLVNPSAPIHIYRIAQEAALNAVKHGSATVIRIELTVDSENIRIVINDNGAGMKLAQPVSYGAGIDRMHYRVAVLNGNLDIVDNADGGLKVVCDIPNTAIDTGLRVNISEEHNLSVKNV